MPAVAILPIKSLEKAKTRLALEMSAELRRAPAQAMFADVLAALRRADQVSEIVVVSSDDGVRQTALDDGAEVLKDSVTGHNDAAAVGIARAIGKGVARVLLVPGDCPLLTPSELDALIARPCAPRSAVIVPDRHGTGTNALLLTPPSVVMPSFGPGSKERHVRLAQRQGSPPEVVAVPGLALDVDTPEDLAALRSALAGTSGGAAHNARHSRPVRAKWA